VALSSLSSNSGIARQWWFGCHPNDVTKVAGHAPERRTARTTGLVKAHGESQARPPPSLSPLDEGEAGWRDSALSMRTGYERICPLGSAPFPDHRLHRAVPLHHTRVEQKTSLGKRAKPHGINPNREQATARRHSRVACRIDPRAGLLAEIRETIRGQRYDLSHGG
jgi:hypothetical protein